MAHSGGVCRVFLVRILFLLSPSGPNNWGLKLSLLELEVMPLLVIELSRMEENLEEYGFTFTLFILGLGDDVRCIKGY